MLARLLQKQIPLMVGIDIGSHSIKAVLLSNNGDDTQLEAFEIVPMPKGAIHEREVQDIEAVGRALSSIKKKLGKSVKLAAAAVSGSTVITKVIFMDANLSDDEQASQIEIEADSLIPYPLDEVSIDFEQLDVNEADPSKVNVLLSAARTESVQARVSALAEGGFEAKIVDVEAYALSRAAQLCFYQLPEDAKDKKVGIIDIGATVSLFAVIENGKTSYTRDQIFGGEQFTRSIVSCYGKSYDEAELAKISNDLPPNANVEVVAPFQTNLIQQVRRSIQMYTTTSGSDKIDYLLLSGGTAKMEGLAELLESELSIPTVIAAPFDELSLANDVDEEALREHATSLLVATGLAQRSFSSWHT